MYSACNEKAASARHRQRRGGDDVERRVRRAENLVHVGEFSSARQALEGAALAPGTRATLDKLQDARRRLPQPREALPRDHGFPTCNSLRFGRENVLSTSVLHVEGSLVAHLA